MDETSRVGGRRRPATVKSPPPAERNQSSIGKGSNWSLRWRRPGEPSSTKTRGKAHPRGGPGPGAELVLLGHPHVAAAIIAGGGSPSGQLYRPAPRADAPTRAMPAGQATCGYATALYYWRHPGKRVAHTAHLFAFPVWTFAVLAWPRSGPRTLGRYWGWDPARPWAFITCVVRRLPARTVHRRVAGQEGRVARLGRVRRVLVQLRRRQSVHHGPAFGACSRTGRRRCATAMPQHVALQRSYPRHR